MASDPGIYAPEPYLDPPPRPRRRRIRPRDPSDPSEAGEMDWGPGLIPRHANGRPPSEGGQYMPKCPPVELPGMSLTPRQQRRPKGEVKGYPGERVG
jgi:hypothetical protein